MTDDQPSPLMEDALRWLAVLQDGAIPPAEQRAFEVWLAASPAHRDAWQRAQYVWARVDILAPVLRDGRAPSDRSEEHTSELQSLMRISYAVFCLKKKTER